MSRNAKKPARKLKVSMVTPRERRVSRNDDAVIEIAEQARHASREACE